jgi:uncharacterized repeat protein (TIGR01451 family)
MKRVYVVRLAAVAGLAIAASSAVGQTFPLKISQVYGGAGGAGATYGRDYVELYNAGAAPIDLSGLSIQYAATTGTSWSARALTGTIQPGKYFLISLSTTLNPVTALELPTPDFQSATALAMSATAGKVALVNGTTTITTGTSCPTTNIIDFVGYGTGTNCFEGSGPTGSISIVNAAFRSDGGCADTNVNSADFAVAAALPRNSASPANPTPCVPAGADLAVTLGSSVSCVAPVGATVTYGYTVTNFGPSATTDGTVVFTLPAGSTFVSSIPAGTPVGNMVTLSTGGLAVSGVFAGSVTVQLSAPGLVQASVSASSTTPDAGTGNNTRTLTGSRAFAFTNPLASAILTNELGRKSALDAVNLPGVNISGGELSRFYMSADGNRWIAKVNTDAAGTATTDEALIVGTGTSWSVVAREAVTNLAEGDQLVAFGLYQAVNNAGDFAFDADTNAATNDEVVVKQLASGGGLVTVAREGGSIGPISGATWGAAMGSVTISNAGQTAFHASIVGQSPTTDSGVFRSDGAVVIAQEGVDTPTGQVDGSGVPTAFSYKAFNSGTSDSTGSFVAADGVTWNAAGSINASTTVPTTSGVDIVLVQNNAVVVQENIAPPFSTSTADDISPVAFNYLTPGGAWVAYGDFNGDVDWAARNGVLLAQTDQPITPLNSETYDDALFSAGFFAVTSNNVGDWVVGGTTSETDTARDAVLVLNGTTVVARQSDPIDIDGNGVFDDDAYIDTFRNDHIALTDSGVLYFNVQYRTAAQICAGTAGTFEAFVRVQLPVATSGRCCVGARCSIVTSAQCVPGGGVAGAVFTAGATGCNASGTFNTPCCFADYNKSGNVNVQDIFDYLTDFFGGSPNANVGGDGVAPAAVQDIFDFLAAWFGGC